MPVVETLENIFTENLWIFQTWQNSNNININVIKVINSLSLTLRVAFGESALRSVSLWLSVLQSSPLKFEPMSNKVL